MDKRYRSWCFTYNNPTISPTSLISLLQEGHDTLKIVFQLERGETTGTEHYQGVIQYRHQVAFKTLKGIEPTIHWEPCRNLRASLAYSTKADTRVSGPWCVGWNPGEQIRTLLESNFSDWQRDLHRLVGGDEPHPRFIYWCWEQRGGVGKTAWCKWAAVHRSALVLGGKSADIKFGVAQRVRERGGLGLAIFHFTRTVESYVSYEALEAVKDGIFFSGKYEGGMVVYDTPHVVCFANFPPDIGKLSVDRWRIYHIVENKLELDIRCGP